MIFIQLPKEDVRNTSSLEKKIAKLERVLTNITVSNVEEHADCPETIYNDPIDLLKLGNKNSNLMYKRKYHIR